MRYLGVDYGRARIGLAVSDPLGSFAFAHSVLKNSPDALATITSLVQEKSIGMIVMGDTLADDGAENTVTIQAKAFADALKEKTGLPVEFVREAWSSFEAARYAPSSEKRDDAAAAIILQRYLDTRRT